MRPLSRIAVMLGAAWIATSGAGCLQWFSGKVASGVGRLTMRNVAVLVALANDDTECGFANETIDLNPRIEGEVGSIGVVTWRVENCTLDYPEKTQVLDDCHDVLTHAKGSVTFTAEKIVEGRITGDPETPVVPSSADSARFEILETEFRNFKVSRTNSSKALTIKKGGITGTVRPRLARDISNGACSISTPNISFENIRYSKSEVHVKTPDRSFDVPVKTALLNAQSGEKDGTQNYIAGRVTVWGRNKKIPNDSDGLDPEFDELVFLSSYACEDDLYFPVSFECKIDEELSHGAARLSVLTVGGLVGSINDDADCGFESPNVKFGFNSQGTLGDPGSVTYRVENCLLDFPMPHALATNCNEITTYVQGQAIVSGTKTVKGYLTGDPEEPVVPFSRDPATFELNAELIDWVVTKDESEKYMHVATGSVSVKVEPRTALDTESDVCSFATPVAKLSNLAWNGAQVRLTSEGSSFDLGIDSSDLLAVNGRRDNAENYLAGTITVDGEPFTIPEYDPALDPDYDPVDFMNAIFSCEPDIIRPRTEADCNFDDTLAQGGARLLIRAIAFAVAAVESDESCGFSDPEALLPDNLTGEPGGLLTWSWDVDGCTIDASRAPLLALHTCDDDDVYVNGLATITATKSATGLLAASNPPVHPIDRNSVNIVVDQLHMRDYAVQEYLAGDNEPQSYMTVHSGFMSGISEPVTGEAADTPGAFFIKSRVVGFRNVRAFDAKVTLFSEAKRFNFTIDEAYLDAFAGAYDGQRNELTGSIMVNGRRYNIPIDEDEVGLDPDYDQAEFDENYACEENLLELVPPN